MPHFPCFLTTRNHFRWAVVISENADTEWYLFVQRPNCKSVKDAKVRIRWPPRMVRPTSSARSHGERTMKAKRFTEEQIIGFRREADKGVSVKELCCTFFGSHPASSDSATRWKDSLIRSWPYLLLAPSGISVWLNT